MLNPSEPAAEELGAPARLPDLMPAREEALSDPAPEALSEPGTERPDVPVGVGDASSEPDASVGLTQRIEAVGTQFAATGYASSEPAAGEANRMVAQAVDAPQPRVDAPPGVEARPPLDAGRSFPAVAEAMPPLADALGVAARLTADANAAAVALENLKRLLEERRSALSRSHDAERPVAPVEAHAARVPTARPYFGALQRAAPLARSAALPALARLPAPPEVATLDLRGFFAGVAIAAAFGVVLYIYLIAG